MDFLIVGGGIGGAVLAELLARGGRKVLMLEKRTASPDWVRPELLWPATVDVLFSLRKREDWSAALLPLQGVAIHNGQRAYSTITPELLQEAGLQPWLTNPNQTRSELLSSDNFELRRGVEVIAVLKGKDRVVGLRARQINTGEEYELEARLTVGDDGADSVVRKACGIEIRTRMFPLDFLCFGFAWPATLPSATIHVWPELKRPGSGIFALGAFPLPNGQGAGVVGVRPMLFDDPAQSDQCWARFCSQDPLIRDVVQARRFPNDFMRIRRPWGHAVRYGLEGVALLGDAIHPVSPVGAQGANMSIADACVLAELALRDEATLAQEYERRRRPANERSIRFTRRAALILELPDWCFRWFPTSILLSILPWVGRHRSLLHHAIRSAAGAFQER